jgi:phage I-like protein
MKLTVGGRPLRHYESTIATESLVSSDGTIWSHAATLGTRFKGDSFTIDQSVVQNFVKVFTSGYPKKVPVDYEHASTTDDPEVRKLRAQGMVPKAGDVVELRGVFSPNEFGGDLKTAAEKLSAQANRPLDDPRNLGLWMRWKPTQRALAAIKAGEYTELSIAFDDDLPHNTDGNGQGPGLWAVALLNTPFLDDMLPVAASRDPHQASGTRPDAEHSHETPLMNQKLISLVAALRSKSVATEDEAITELTALQADLQRATANTTFRESIVAEFGNEADASKIIGTVRELRAKVASAEQAAKEAKAKELKASVDAALDRHKNKLTVLDRDIYAEKLTAELESGVKLEDTKVVKALEAKKELSIFTQSSSGDAGAAGTDDDDKLEALAQQLLREDPVLLNKAKGDHYGAYMQALEKANRQLRTAAR